MPARHTSLPDGLLLQRQISKERLLSTKRVSARHQVNGRIVVSKRAFCSKTGPAEETGFLRSVRILQVRNFSGLKGRLASSLPASSLRLPGTRLKSDPDVFADALVPVRRRWCSGSYIFMRF